MTKPSAEDLRRWTEIHELLIIILSVIDKDGKAGGMIQQLDRLFKQDRIAQSKK